MKLCHISARSSGDERGKTHTRDGKGFIVV